MFSIANAVYGMIDVYINLTLPNIASSILPITVSTISFSKVAILGIMDKIEAKKE